MYGKNGPNSSFFWYWYDCSANWVKTLYFWTFSIALDNLILHLLSIQACITNSLKIRFVLLSSSSTLSSTSSTSPSSSSSSHHNLISVLCRADVCPRCFFGWVFYMLHCLGLSLIIVSCSTRLSSLWPRIQGADCFGQVLKLRFWTITFFSGKSI